VEFIKAFFDWTASVIDSIVWPGLIVALVIIFRKPVSGILEGPISEIIKRLTGLSYKGAELTFEKAVSQIEEAEGAVAVSAEEAGGEATQEEVLKEQGFPEGILALAQRSPDVAIVLAWETLSGELSSAARQLGAKHLGALGSLSYLRRGDHLTWSQYELMRSMRKLRSEAMHSHAHYNDAAYKTHYIELSENYIEEAQRMVDHLRRIAPRSDANDGTQDGSSEETP